MTVRGRGRRPTAGPGCSVPPVLTVRQDLVGREPRPPEFVYRNLRILWVVFYKCRRTPQHSPCGSGPEPLQSRGGHPAAGPGRTRPGARRHGRRPAAPPARARRAQPAPHRPPGGRQDGDAQRVRAVRPGPGLLLRAHRGGRGRPAGPAPGVGGSAVCCCRWTPSAASAPGWSGRSGC